MSEGRMTAEQTPDIEALARLIFEHTDERCDDITCGDGFGYHDLDSRDDRRLGCEHLARVILDSPVLAAAVRDAKQRVASAFAEWAMKNEIAGPPLDWAWFGEITRRYWPHHPEYRADRVAEPQHEAATSGNEIEASDE